MITRIKLILLALIICFCSYTQSIDSTLEKELYSFQDSSRTLARNTRSMVFKYVEKNDVQKVKQILTYTEEKLNTKLYPLYTDDEKLLLDCFLGNYDQVLQSYHQTTATYSYDNHGRTFGYRSDRFYDYPDIDYRYPIQLDLIMIEVLPELNESIEATNYPPEEKEFLKLLLREKLILLEDLSADGAAFVDRYPQSEYAEYVKMNMRKWYTRGNESFYMYIGGSSNTFNGGLSEAIDFESSLNYGFGGFLNRKMIGLHFKTTFAESTQAFSNQGEEFIEGTPLYALNYTLSFGYAILDTDIIRITPVVDLGGIYVSVPSGQEDDYPGPLSMGSVAGGYGVAIDLLPFKYQKKAYYNEVLHRFGVRLQAGRMHHLLENVDSSFAGEQDYYGFSLLYDVGNMKIDMR